MKLLFLSHRFFPDIGGIEVNSEILAKHFSAAGHDVRLLTWTVNPEPDDYPFAVIRSPSVTELFREHRWADVVYENNICLRLAWPAALLRKRSVIALRTWIERPNGEIGAQDRVKKLWLRRVKRVIAISNAVRDRCWPMATVIGNPYRSELFRIESEVERDRDFVFLGRLVSDKGVDMALRALASLRANADRDYTLTVIGDGAEKERLVSIAEELGITQLVTFSGSLRGDTLVRTLNRHRYLWVPSKWEEPFGNVALEGMACGCIPIVSDGGGLPDAVGLAGITFRRGDLEDVVAQTERLLNDAELQRRLTEAAHAHLENHRPEKVAQRYLEAIEDAVGKNHRT